MLRIQYRTENGEIQGVWSANPPELLDAQTSDGDPAFATLLLETELMPQALLAGYRIQNGALVPWEAPPVEVPSDPARGPLTARERQMADVMLQMLNEMRAAMGLPPRTADEMETMLQQKGE